MRNPFKKRYRPDWMVAADKQFNSPEAKAWRKQHRKLTGASSGGFFEDLGALFFIFGGWR
jgi:hypothetical protein